MSETGLYSMQYQQTQDWAEVIDQLLIAIKSGSVSPLRDSRMKVGQLLHHLAKRDYRDPATRFMVLLLQDKVALPTTVQLSRIGTALLQADYDDEVITSLENIAQILEHEQLGAVARMHRWTR